MVSNARHKKTEVQEYLNDLVASYGVFYTKLHQHHWFVQGNHFFVLHEQFEDLYDEFNEQFDELAERLIAIGGKPYSTLAEFLEHSIIEEKPYTEKVSQEEMVESIVSDLGLFRDNLQKGIKLTEDHDDDVTNDILIGYKTDIDKKIWMFQAFLGKDPLEK